MKTKILLTSAGSAGIATVLGITAVLFQGGSTPEAVLSSIVATTKLYQIASMFGLLGIATFFVGMVYPASNSEVGSGNTVTAKVKRG